MAFAGVHAHVIALQEDCGNPTMTNLPTYIPKKMGAGNNSRDIVGRQKINARLSLKKWFPNRTALQITSML